MALIADQPWSECLRHGADRSLWHLCSSSLETDEQATLAKLRQHAQIAQGLLGQTRVHAKLPGIPRHVVQLGLPCS